MLANGRWQDFLLSLKRQVGGVKKHVKENQENYKILCRPNVNSCLKIIKLVTESTSVLISKQLTYSWAVWPSTVLPRFSCLWLILGLCYSLHSDTLDSPDTILIDYYFHLHVLCGAEPRQPVKSWARPCRLPFTLVGSSQQEVQTSRGRSSYS